MARKEVVEVITLMSSHAVTFKELIDGYIELEGIIGVGLITLEKELVKIVDAHHGYKREDWS